MEIISSILVDDAHLLLGLSFLYRAHVGISVAVLVVGAFIARHSWGSGAAYDVAPSPPD